MNDLIPYYRVSTRRQERSGLSSEGQQAAVASFAGSQCVRVLAEYTEVESGKLADTECAATDRAASICPVGVILPKRKGFAVPIGERKYDLAPISEQVREKMP